MNIERKLVRAAAVIGLAGNLEACEPGDQPKHQEPTHQVEPTSPIEAAPLDRNKAIQEIVQGLDTMKQNYEACMATYSACMMTVNNQEIDLSKVFTIRDNQWYVKGRQGEVKVEDFASKLFLEHAQFNPHQPIQTSRDLGVAFWSKVNSLQYPEPTVKTGWAEIKAVEK